MRARVQEALKARKIAFQADVQTATLSSFRIGGKAALVIEPRCTGELIEAVVLCEQYGLDYAVIGKGSNVLFGDETIETVLIRTVYLDAVQSLPDGRIRALCGVPLGRLAALSAREGFGGLCFAAGIPGTLGGAVFMNAGTNTGEMADVVESAEVLLPEKREIKTLFNQELSFSYRKSYLQDKNAILLSALLKLRSGFDPKLLFEEMRSSNRLRKANQPLEFPSAGSVFRKPDPDIAISKIVDELGLKGRRIGGAEVSKKHAGFIVNVGGATFADVRALIEEIQNTVEREKGFRPIPEIRFIPEV